MLPIFKAATDFHWWDGNSWRKDPAPWQEMEEDGADGDEKECQDTWPEHEDPKVCVPNAEVAEWEEDGEDLAAPEDDLWEQEEEEEEEAEGEAFEEHGPTRKRCVLRMEGGQ